MKKFKPLPTTTCKYCGHKAEEHSTVGKHCPGEPMTGSKEYKVWSWQTFSPNLTKEVDG